MEPFFAQFGLKPLPEGWRNEIRATGVIDGSVVTVRWFMGFWGLRAQVRVQQNLSQEQSWEVFALEGGPLGLQALVARQVRKG